LFEKLRGIKIGDGVGELIKLTCNGKTRRKTRRNDKHGRDEL
jgi:hypothetical protein